MKQLLLKVFRKIVALGQVPPEKKIIYNYSGNELPESSFKNFDGCGIGENSKIVVHHAFSKNQATQQRTLITFGEKSWIGDYCELNIDLASQISIGHNASIQDFCKIIGNVDIGSYTLLAPNVFISSGNHAFNIKPALPIRIQDELASEINIDKKVTIGEDCWLGKNSVVLAGTNIGRGCIVGANAVVKGVYPPYSIIAGSPGKVVKKRLEFKSPLFIDSNKENDIPYFYKGFDQIGLFGKKADYKVGLEIIDTGIVALSSNQNGSFLIEVDNQSGESATLTLVSQNNFQAQFQLKEGLNTIETRLDNSDSTNKTESFFGIEHLEDTSLVALQVNASRNIFLKRIGFLEFTK